MAGGFGVAGSGGDGTVRGDGHAARIGGVAGVRGSPVEWQQSIERLDFGPSNPTDDVGQISFRIDAVQPAGLHQAVDHGGDPAGGIRADHVPILAPDGYAAQRPLGRQVVDLQRAVGGVADQGIPLGVM
jgi:hypothetical protein